MGQAGGVGAEEVRFHLFGRPVVGRADVVLIDRGPVPGDGRGRVLVFVDQPQRVPKFVQHHLAHLVVRRRRREPAKVHGRFVGRHPQRIVADKGPGAGQLKGNAKLRYGMVAKIKAEV